jgi:hypothetical protein
MRTSMAYFAGVGTVVAAVVVGLGGGVLISNIVSPHAPKIEMSKLELRMSEKPIAVTNASLEPVPNASPTAKPVEAQATVNATASPPPAASLPQAAASVTQATSEKTNSEQIKTPEAAFAKAREADVRREARRAAEEKRKAERRQQWAERRRPRPDQELRDVEQKVREETKQPRAFAAEPVRFDRPRIQLFGSE